MDRKNSQRFEMLGRVVAFGTASLKKSVSTRVIGKSLGQRGRAATGGGMWTAHGAG